MDVHPGTYQVELKDLVWLSDKTFEATLARPPGFSFIPGQYLRFVENEIQRDYTIVSAPEEPLIRLCIRRIAQGTFSEIISGASPGCIFNFTGPHGYFRYLPSGRQAVFIATGTGIAPFTAFARAGATGFILLHGISSSSETYYRRILEPVARLYVPCISSGSQLERTCDKPEAVFHGRVTRYVETVLPVDEYDFYLCGNSGMIADMTGIIDAHFSGSRVFSEIFT